MRRVLALVLVFVLTAAACGSDSDSSSDDTAAAPATTTAPAVTTTAAPAVPTTTAAPAVTTTTAAPVVTTTTAAPAVTTTTAAPIVTTTTAAPSLPAVVEGTLLDGATPEGLVNLVSESNIPPTEACEGTPIFSGVSPVAYSAASWAKDTTTGPFLDVWAARFESTEAAAQAIADYNAELIDCGEFREPTAGAVGAFVAAEDPGLGDQSYGLSYAGVVSGFPVNRYGILARVDDTVYQAGLAVLFVDPDQAAVLHAINAILGL